MPFYIGLVKKFVQIFHNILWKNLNKLLGQPDVTTGYFYRALYTPVSQNIQIYITGSNMSSFLGRQEIVDDVEQNKMARGTRKMYDFLRLSSAVIEYDTTISYFCSCYIHTHHKFASALFLIHLLSGTKEASTIWGILISWLTGKCRRQSHMMVPKASAWKWLMSQFIGHSKLVAKPDATGLRRKKILQWREVTNTVNGNTI